MNRRTAVALAAIAALGATAPAAHAASKNTITTTGKTTFKVNQYVQDGSRFAPGTITVKSGTTIKLVNKSADGAPHSLSLIKKSALPKTAAQVMSCPMCAPLMAAHQADPNTGQVGVPLYRHGRARLPDDGRQEDRGRLDLPAAARQGVVPGHGGQEGLRPALLLRRPPVDAGDDQGQVEGPPW